VKSTGFATSLAVLAPGIFLTIYSVGALLKGDRVGLSVLAWRPLLLGSLLLVAPLLVNLDQRALLQNSLQLIFGLLVMAGFFKLRFAPGLRYREIALGILLATSVMAIVSILQVIVLPTEVLESIFSTDAAGRATGWLTHPNLWGLTGIIPGLLIFTLPRQVPLALVNLIPTLTIVLASGSRTAAALLGVTLLGLAFACVRKRQRLTMLLVLTLLAFPASYLLFNNAWFLRFNPLPSHESRLNLLLSSEDLNYGAWSHLQVKAVPDQLGAALGSTKRKWRIQKTGDAWWARLKQSVTLQPGHYYSWQSEFRTKTNEATSGVHGIGQGENYVFLNAYRSGNEWTLQTEGAIDEASFNVTSLPNSWERVQVSFRFIGEHRVGFHIGPTPDQRRLASAAILEVRAMQFAEGSTIAPYQPTYPSGIDSRASLGTLEDRISYSSAAVSGWIERPIFGWGSKRFRAYWENSQNGTTRVAHAHNLFTQTLFERGSVGFIGLLLFLYGLVESARLFRFSTAVLFAILVANLIDYTFWSSAVFYPLLGLLGWDAGGRARKPVMATETV
jgi:hypothetical protein